MRTVRIVSTKKRARTRNPFQASLGTVRTVGHLGTKSTSFDPEGAGILSAEGSSQARMVTGRMMLTGLGDAAVVRLFDATFMLGTILVVVAIGVAVAAVTRDDLPLVGTGVGALIAVAVIGMAGCAVGGIAQAPVAGWTSPTIILGIVLGVVALVVVAAGVFGWTGVLQPVAQLVPGHAGTLVPARVAIVVLGALIAVKWLIATAMAAVAR